jgi:alpha-amylase
MTAVSHHHRLGSRPAALLLAAFLLAACGGEGEKSFGSSPTRPLLPETWRPSGRAAAGDVMVHLFEWPWPDIADECENVLGPAGVALVQVSPPQEHSITPNRDWSERYQPVSYSLARSRSGTEAEFIDMVNRCKAAGVGIVVDAVINHMTNFPSPGVGSAGTAYTRTSYPGLWTSADFHSGCAITNYQNPAEVQDCDLLGLPDLHTGLPPVRQRLAQYLVDLARLGVAGFRIDAAKHIQQVELDSIIGLANTTLVAEGKSRPYVFLEVIGSAGEALQEHHYYGVGYSTGGAADITEFTFTGVGSKFLNLNGERMSDLNPAGPPGKQFSEAAWGMIPSAKALVFLQNHDTQRTCGLGYQHGDRFRLANVWMLAQPYGFPSVLSGYAFTCPSGASMGPVSDAEGWTLPVNCAASFETATPGAWTCEHRDPSVLSMVRFRRVTAGTPVTHWWDDGLDAIAFGRGTVGFVVINGNATGLTDTLTTGLPAGEYCDRLTGGRAGAACAGTTLTVDSAGKLPVDLAPRTAIAVDTATKL